MLKPLSVLIAIMLVVSASTCAVNRQIVQTNTSGRPFDWLGDSVKCQMCNTGGVRAGEGYAYHCPTCKARYRARWNDDTKTIEIDW